MFKGRQLKEVEHCIIKENLGGIPCKCKNEKYIELVETPTGHILCSSCKKVIVRNVQFKNMVHSKRMEFVIQGHTEINVYSTMHEDLIGNLVYQ